MAQRSLWLVDKSCVDFSCFFVGRPPGGHALASDHAGKVGIELVARHPIDEWKQIVEAILIHSALYKHAQVRLGAV